MAEFLCVACAGLCIASVFGNWHILQIMRTEFSKVRKSFNDAFDDAKKKLDEIEAEEEEEDSL